MWPYTNFVCDNHLIIRNTWVIISIFGIYFDTGFKKIDTGFRKFRVYIRCLNITMKDSEITLSATCDKHT